MDFENILLNLEFISKIPKGAKPCYSNRSLTYTDQWFVTLRRRWNGEKGEKGVIHVKRLLDSCDKYYRMCNLDGFGISDCDKLRTLLYESIQGLNNLVHTYLIDEQKNVSDDYQKCIDRAKHIIRGIEYKIVEIETHIKNKGFFGFYPKIITTSTDRKKIKLDAKQKFHSDLN